MVFTKGGILPPPLSEVWYISVFFMGYFLSKFETISVLIFDLSLKVYFMDHHKCVAVEQLYDCFLPTLKCEPGHIKDDSKGF